MFGAMTLVRSSIPRSLIRTTLLLLPFLGVAEAWGVDIPERSLVRGAAKAISGDTLSIDGGQIRLMGIEAPELDQICLNRYESPFDCGTVAKAALEALVKGQKVECTVAGHDRDGNSQGECRVNGADIGGAMVARGWAFAYRSMSHAYSEAEAYAQSKRIGLWSGKVEKPHQWRSRMLGKDAPRKR